MKQQVRFFLCLCVAGAITSCNAPFRPNPDLSHEAVVKQYQTVSVLLTVTAQVTATAAPVAEVRPAVRTVVSDVPQSNPLPPQPQVIPVATDTQVLPSPTFLPPRSTATPKALQSSAERPAPPCEMAQPGRILDVSVPDDTRFQPGEYFSKTWRLVNAGSCTWTRDYAVIWFSGDDLGVVRAQNFETEVIPGQTVDVTVDMAAPQAPGAYQSNWKLRSAQGALFGIGPAGASPFWVRIIVVPVDTPTVAAPVPTVTATAAPVLLAGGNASLTLETTLDLDTGQPAARTDEDLALQQNPEGQPVLSAVNGARFVPFGVDAPDLPDCLVALINDAYPAPDLFQPGSYYCYRTSEGLPGWFELMAVNPDNPQADLQFVTWAAP